MDRLTTTIARLARRGDNSVKLNIVNLVCIIVGSAIGLTLTTLAIIFLIRLILKRRHKRAMADVEKKGTMRQATLFQNQAATVSSPHLSISKAKKSQKELRNLNVPAPNGQLYGTREEQWAKEIPYPRMDMYMKSNRSKTRRSKRDSLPRNFKRTQLSAVIESPRSQTFDTSSPETRAGEQVPKKIWSPFRLRKGTSQRPGRVTPPPFEPRPPMVGQRVNTRERGGSRNAGRPQSAPTVAIDQLPRDAIIGYTASRPTAHLRSWSVGSRYPSMAPTEPPPPLPTATPPDVMRRQNYKGTLRPISNESLASSHSAGSSIIGNAPRSRSRAAGFTTRHPEMRLGAEKREYDDQLKTSLIGNAKYYSPEDVGKAITTSLTKGETHIESHNGLKVCTIRNEDSAIALSDQYARDGMVRHAPATPRHHWRHNRGSETGSPTTRKRNSVGLLADPSSNDTSPVKAQANYAAQCMSGQDTYAQDDRSFVHRRVDSVVKPSAMKGSPSARRSHRRQNCVRIEINPTVMGPENAGQTAWDAEEMAEEVDIGLAGLGAPKWATASNFGSDHPEYSLDVPNFSMRQSSTTAMTKPGTFDAPVGEESLVVPDLSSPDITLRNSTTWTGSKWGPDGDWEYDLNVHNASRQTTGLQLLNIGLMKTPIKDQQVLEPRDNSLDSASFHTPPSDAGIQQTENLPVHSTPHIASLGETNPNGIPDANMLSATPTPSRRDQLGISPPQSPSFSYPLTHQRQQSTPDVMRSVKALRRMNSEIMDDPLECSEGRRYLGLGAETSPDPNNLLMPTDHVFDFHETIGAENERVHNGSDSFWARDSLSDKRGCVETLPNGGMRNSQSMLYDEEGFLKITPS